MRLQTYKSIFNIRATKVKFNLERESKDYFGKKGCGATPNAFKIAENALCQGANFRGK
ncbi:MAG: hypothetical protein NT027_17000 [Proteobacteria bacterium]|nr:hypothetical protein [Pseudomonadota bacterium]